MSEPGGYVHWEQNLDALANAAERIADALERSHPAKGIENVGTTTEAATSEQEREPPAPYDPVVPTHCPCCGSNTTFPPLDERLKRAERDRSGVLHQLAAALADADRMREALERLASTEAFVSAIDMNHAPRDAIVAEIMARGRYAQAALDSASTRGDA